MGLVAGALIAACWFQDPLGPPVRDPEEIFTERLASWLRLQTRSSWPGPQDPSSSASLGELTAARRDLFEQANAVGLPAALAEPNRLRQLFEPAIVGVSRDTEEVPRPIGSRDAWLWLSARPPLGSGPGGYRVIVRMVQDAERLRSTDPSQTDPQHPGLVEPWPNSGVLVATAVVALQLPVGFDFQDALWGETGAGREREAARVAAVERALRTALSRIPRWDANRLVLDCDRGTCAFGLRLLTYWPQRFSGALLRDPEIVPTLSLDAIATGVGLVVDSLSREAADELQARLDEHFGRRDAAVRLAARSFEGFESRIVEAEWSAYERWLDGLEREAEVRSTVVAAPNGLLGSGSARLTLHLDADSHGANRDARAEAVFDRAKNKVTVVTRGVRAITFWLDDRFVDLDGPITFVLDGTPVVERLVRDFGCACERAALTWDPSDLASAKITLALPRRD